LRPRLTTGLPFSLAHKDASTCRHTFPGWVAGPGLVGSEVAVLRPHVGSSSHVTAAAYSCERGGRITQLQYLFHLSLRTSENSVHAKFGIARPRRTKTADQVR
jgi:hypothetical protein